MKKKIAVFILWDIVIYFIIFLNYSISHYLETRTAKEFNNNYTFYSILINMVLFIIMGFVYNIITNYKSNEKTTDKSSILQFVIIGINFLFLSTLFMWTWFDINFLPDWLAANSVVTSSLGSIMFGQELFWLIKSKKLIKSNK